VTAGHPPANVRAIDARSDFELTVTGREAGLDAHRLQAPDCPSNAVRRNDFLHIGLPQASRAPWRSRSRASGPAFRSSAD
jgi:hypothetical protein